MLLFVANHVFVEADEATDERAHQHKMEVAAARPGARGGVAGRRVGLVLAAFIATMAFGLARTRQLDEAAAAIADIAAPSIERLATARAELHGLREALTHVASVTQAPGGADLAAARAALRGLESDVQVYVSMPAFEGERAIFGDLGERLPVLAQVVEEILSAAQLGRSADAVDLLQRRFLPQFEALSSVLLGAIRFNAENAATLGRKVRTIRARASLITYGTEALALSLGGLALAFGLAFARERRRLVKSSGRAPGAPSRRAGGVFRPRRARFAEPAEPAELCRERGRAPLARRSRHAPEPRTPSKDFSTSPMLVPGLPRERVQSCATSWQISDPSLRLRPWRRVLG